MPALRKRDATRWSLVGLALVVGLIAAVARVTSGRVGPNVLVLVMDTTRADRCSICGCARDTTPRLREFARDATVFRDAWSPANWTGPAHASLFTGLRVEHHGLHEQNRRYLADEFVTLAETLKDAGYATGCFTNNDTVSTAFGLTQGFSTIERLYARPDRPYPYARETHEMAAEWARARARTGHPFFLFVNDMEPHLPYTPPPEFASKFLRGDASAVDVATARSLDARAAGAMNLGMEHVGPGAIAAMSDLYDAEIATLDAEIGKFLDGLRADGLLDSTLVVIAADHGENLGEHGMFEHGIGLSRTLLHVPLVVRFPGRFDGGRVVDDVVRLEDVFPTVLEVCGLAVPSDVDGVSLVHDVPGRIARASQPRLDRSREAIENLFGAAAGLDRLLRGVVSAYDGRFHLLRLEDGSEELFDVVDDPGETRDVSASRADVAQRLSALLPELPTAPSPIQAAPATPK